MKIPEKPFPPYESSYESYVERVHIYSFTESLQDYEEDKPEKKDVDIRKINLQWLLDKLPEGVTPKQVKISFGYNASSMSYDDHYVGFYYEKKIPACKKEYKLALKKYEAELAQYEKDLVIYNDWLKAEKIKQLKSQLNQLEQ